MHISQLHKVVEHGEFSMKFVSAEGEVIEVLKCICTSFHSSGTSLNIKFVESEEIRTVNRHTIIQINNEELHL